MNIPRVLIAGAGTGAHWNAGDAAILSAMTSHLKETIPGALIEVVSANPPGALDRFGVTEVRFDEIGSLVDAADRADLLLIGGGGLFYDYWPFPPDQILTPSHAGLSFYAGIALLASLLGKRLMMYAAGVGPLRSEEGKQLTRVAFEQADAITVRDRYSAELLERLGIAAERIDVTADPAFALGANSADPGFIGKNLPRPLIGVATRDWHEPDVPSGWQSELAAALDAFGARHGGTVLFLPFHRSVGDVSDTANERAIRDAMRSGSAAVMLDEAHTPEELSAAIAECDLVVGMRLHSLIFARTQGVPFVALSYDPKVDGTAQGELSRFVVPLQQLTSERVSELLEGAWRQKSAIRTSLLSEMRALSAAARDNARRAAALLNAPPRKRTHSGETATVISRLAAIQLRRAAELETTIAGLRAEAVQRQEAIDWLREELRLREQQIERLRAEASGIAPTTDAR